MRLLITALLALFVAIALGVFIKHDPGLVVISYAGTTVQTPFSIFVAALILLVIALFFVVASMRVLIRLPRALRHWRSQRRHRRQEGLLNTALLSMAEGDWKAAENAFRRGAAAAAAPLVNYLGAARAAQQQGALQRRDHYLRLAHDHSAQSAALGLTQAELQLDRQQTEQAYATLKKLDAEQPDLAPVQLLLLEAGADLEDWAQMLVCLEKVERKRLLSTQQIRAKRLNAYAGLLRRAGQSSARDKLDEQWQKIPKKLRREACLLKVYVQERLWFPDTSDCEPLLRQHLKKNRDDELLRLYGEVAGAQPDKQLAFAEKQLAGHADDPVLLLTLGRLCKRNSLWGKARNYLEASLALAPRPETYRELAALLARQGEHNAAAICYQEGLEQATERHRQGSISPPADQAGEIRSKSIKPAALPLPGTQAWEQAVLK